MKNLLAGCLIALVSVIFALQNAELVTVEFLNFKLFEISVALVIILSLFIGVLTGWLFSGFGAHNRRKMIKEQKEKISELEKQLTERIA